MTRRRLVVGLAVGALFFGTASYAIAATGSQPVTCDYTDGTLSCPIPQPDPVTVTETSTASTTTTVTADPITVLATVTATTTVNPPTVTVPGPTVTVTKTTTKTVAPTTTTAATSTTKPTTIAPVSTTTTAAPQAGYPNASNTGVPAGTVLSAYTGPMTITVAGTIIDSKTITGGLVIRATGVTVKNSKVVGSINADNGGSVAILDTEIDNGHSSVAGVTQDNVTMRRVNVHGGRQSVTCGSNCDIQDSYLHGQTADDPSWHDNGYISNGGSGVLLRHNSIACEGANPVCTGPVALFGDFAPISNVTIDNNLILSTTQGGTLVGAYCVYGGADPGKAYPTPKNVHITNNVFQKGTGSGSNSSARCAYFGAATSLGTAANGNTFTGNVYDDGTPVS